MAREKKAKTYTEYKTQKDEKRRRHEEAERERVSNGLPRHAFLSVVPLDESIPTLQGFFAARYQGALKKDLQKLLDKAYEQETCSGGNSNESDAR